MASFANYARGSSFQNPYENRQYSPRGSDQSLTSKTSQELNLMARKGDSSSQAARDLLIARYDANRGMSVEGSDQGFVFADPTSSGSDSMADLVANFDNFDNLDSDSSGYLTVQELQIIANSGGPSAEAAQYVLNNFYTAIDGVIDGTVDAYYGVSRGDLRALLSDLGNSNMNQERAILVNQNPTSAAVIDTSQSWMETFVNSYKPVTIQFINPLPFLPPLDNLEAFINS